MWVARGKRAANGVWVGGKETGLRGKKRKKRGRREGKEEWTGPEAREEKEKAFAILLKRQIQSI